MEVVVERVGADDALVFLEEGGTYTELRKRALEGVGGAAAGDEDAWEVRLLDTGEVPCDMEVVAVERVELKLKHATAAVAAEQLRLRGVDVAEGRSLAAQWAERGDAESLALLDLLLRAGGLPVDGIAHLLGAACKRATRGAHDKHAEHAPLALLCAHADPAAPANELHRSARHANGAALCGMLVDSGVPVDAVDSSARTALYEAAWAGHVDVCHTLVERGANVNYALPVGRATPLWAAAAGVDRTQALAVCTLLLDHGARVDVCDAFSGRGETPLHLAAARGNAKLCSLLLARGAQVDSPSAEGLTPLFAALTTACECTVTVLLDAGANPHRPCNGRTALYVAVAASAHAVVRLFLARGADVDAANAAGVTPLMCAASRGDLDAVVALLAAGADPNHVNASGSTVLALGAAMSRAPVCAALLHAGARPDVACRGGITPIMRASGDVIDVLREHGASARLGDDVGRTALWRAVTHDREADCKALIAAGADVGAVVDGVPLLWHAVSSCDASRPAVPQLLLAHGADPNASHSSRSCLMVAALSGSVDLVDALVAAGADVNARDAGGRTALMTADVEAARVLIEKHGADVNAADAEGATALMLLCGTAPDGGGAGGVEGVMKCLVGEAGRADVNAVDENGRTALMAAAACGYAAGCRLLLAAGALVALVDGAGRTALHGCLAGVAEMKVEPHARAKQREAVQVLIDAGAVPDADAVAMCSRDAEVHALVLRAAARAAPTEGA